MKQFLQVQWFLALAVFTLPVSAWAQTINNPLVRPAMLSAPASEANPAGNAQAQASNQNSEEVREQAARRLTQEDLNMRQQALNSPVVPLALSNLFINMQVTAHFQGAIVMRKISNELIQTAAAIPGQQGQNGQAAQESVAAANRNVSRSTAVIRLRVGQVTNISGYSVRAIVRGQDVMVDWLGDKGIWVNVFFGAIESSNGGVAQVPTDSQLLKVETEVFDYLVPKLNTQTFSATGVAGNQQGNNGNFGSPFGGGNQGFGQPGFGSSAPF